METVQEFPGDLEDLQMFFSDDNLDSPVRAFPAEGLNVPIYLLGSSMDSAVLAAKKGLPYVFASHFAPTYFLQASNYYKSNFKPSAQQKSPYLIACVNVIIAETNEKAHYLATSFFQMALGIIRGKSYPLPPPVNSMDNIWSDPEAAALQNMMTYTFIGSQSSVKSHLKRFIRDTGVNEIMVTTNIYNHEDRLRSFESVAEILKEIPSRQAAHVPGN